MVPTGFLDLAVYTANISYMANFAKIKVLIFTYKLTYNRPIRDPQG